MSELAGVFADLEDQRAANDRRHSLHDIMVIALILQSHIRLTPFVVASLGSGLMTPSPP